MGAPDLLLHLRCAGFDLTVTADGGIKVTPASALVDVERLAIRTHRTELLALLAGDVPSDDDRVTCASGCHNYRRGICTNFRKAGLASPELGSDLANLLQRCPGYMKGTP